jgi:hypothetical protein
MYTEIPLDLTRFEIYRRAVAAGFYTDQLTQNDVGWAFDHVATPRAAIGPVWARFLKIEEPDLDGPRS